MFCRRRLYFFPFKQKRVYGNNFLKRKNKISFIKYNHSIFNLNSFPKGAERFRYKALSDLFGSDPGLAITVKVVP